MLRQRTKPAHPITHTHTHQGYPPALGAGWPLAGSVQKTRKSGGQGERGAQSGESLNLGVGEERGASKEENKCWGKWVIQESVISQSPRKPGDGAAFDSCYS